MKSSVQKASSMHPTVILILKNFQNEKKIERDSEKKKKDPAEMRCIGT